MIDCVAYSRDQRPLASAQHSRDSLEESLRFGDESGSDFMLGLPACWEFSARRQAKNLMD
jgi:hypothetical protein